MNKKNSIPGFLELAQIGWVVPDIEAATRLLAHTLGVPGFPPVAHISALDLDMTYYGSLVPGDWLTTQAYNGRTFIELIQPLSGRSMFHDYLERYPLGGTQHMAFRLPISGFDDITAELRGQGHALISEVDHPIARMAFFDTYQAMGVATEIMGVTPEGWSAIRQMEQAG